MTLDYNSVAQVTKLLLKAESTDSEAESIALIEKCYRMLAQILTEFDKASSGPGQTSNQRRERRFLFDRRRSRLPEAASPGTPEEAGMALRRYLQSSDREDPGGRVVDVSI